MNKRTNFYDVKVTVGGKEMQIVPIEYDASEFKIPDQYFDTLALIREKAVKDIYQQFEQAVIERLSSLGFQFQTREEFLAFMSERATIVQWDQAKMALVLDLNKDSEKLIGTWNDEFVVDHGDNLDWRKTLTLTYNPR